MATLKEAAESYEPKTTKNISDAGVIPIDIEITSVERTASDGEKFTMNVVEVDGEEYRMPTSVISQLKTLLEEKPDMASFKVKRTGTTMQDTRYTVIPQ